MQKVFGYIGLFTLVALWWLGEVSFLLFIMRNNTGFSGRALSIHEQIDMLFDYI